ncbi:hypothetical protein CLOM_g11967, partial [Closterium sp. NIES-68]
LGTRKHLPGSQAACVCSGGRVSGPRVLPDVCRHHQGRDIRHRSGHPRAYNGSAARGGRGSGGEGGSQHQASCNSRAMGHTQDQG